MLQLLNLNLNNNYLGNGGYADLMVVLSDLTYLSTLQLALKKTKLEFDGFLAT
jgi:hypothetical protein